MDSAPPHNRRHAYLRSSTGGQHPHIHAISDTDFMGQKSLTVRGRNAGVSWRDEEAVEENIFQCCVMGRLERVRYLVEVRQVQVNQRDQWDSTPLYYSCLAGHENLVQYLLEQGSSFLHFTSRPPGVKSFPKIEIISGSQLFGLKVEFKKKRNWFCQNGLT